MHNSHKTIAYFDFDGTISNKDTLIPFLIHSIGLIKFMILAPLLLPFLLCYATKIISNEKMKQITLTLMLKGYNLDKLEQKAESFANTKIDKYIKPSVFAKLEYHREHKHSLALVSANLAIFLRYWAKRHQLDFVVATEIAAVHGRVTGKLLTRNCYAAQKTIRLEEYLQKHKLSYEYCYAYGNSRGDYELLNMADEAYYVTGEDVAIWEKDDVN